LLCAIRLRSTSSLAGDGMKPTSQPSITFLPIHQFWSYLSMTCRWSFMSKDMAAPWTGESSSTVPSKAQFVFTANATGLVRTRCNWYSAWRSVSLLKCSLSSSRLRSDDL